MHRLMTELNNAGDQSNPLDQWTMRIQKGEKQLAVLIDPDKCGKDLVPKLLNHLPNATTHIFVGAVP